MEPEQKRIIQRLAIVTTVLTVVGITAYMAYQPGASTAVIVPRNLRKLQALRTAVPIIFHSGNWLFGPPLSDMNFTFGSKDYLPVSGVWPGSSAPSIGIYKDGKFSLLVDGVVKEFAFGNTTDVPMAADWNGTGHSYLGVYSKGFWTLDMNGNGQYDGPKLDRFIALGGVPGEFPIIGDWNGDGRTKVGVFSDGLFRIDFNGNGVWDKDDKGLFFGKNGDIPVVGDWNGDGRTKIGAFNAGVWVLDYNGNGKWDGPPEDRVVMLGGLPGDMPVVGDWNGDGRTKVGLYRAGTFHLDFNGNGVWDENDKVIALGNIGDAAVILNPVRVKK